jgi:5-methylcytosine-specific restriction endonuclease McrA
MGAHNSTHPGQLLASQRQTASTTPETTCRFCGTPDDDTDDSERIEHVIPSTGASEARTEQYCSPSCFVRQMERVGGID